MINAYETHTTSFGNEVPRCQAKSKRSGDQCHKPAIRGKAVCRTHGGSSTGPKTSEGRKRCAEAKTIHGREGRATRQRRAEKLKELCEIEKLMIDAGLIR